MSMLELLSRGLNYRMRREERTQMRSGGAVRTVSMEGGHPERKCRGTSEKRLDWALKIFKV